MASTELVKGSKAWFEAKRDSFRSKMFRMGEEFNSARFDLWEVKQAISVGPKGGKPKTSSSEEVTSWAGWCRSVGLAVSSADRWLKDFETKMLERGIPSDQIKELGRDEVLDVLVKPVAKQIADVSDDVSAQYESDMEEQQARIAELEEEVRGLKKKPKTKSKSAAADKQDEIDKLEKQLADTKANLKSAKSAKKILEDSDKIVAKWGEGATIELTPSIIRSTTSRAKAAVRGLRNMASMIETAWDLEDE